jgi:hypothetical protein
VINPNKFDIQRYVTTTATPPAVVIDAVLLRKHPCILKLQLPHDWDTLSQQDTMDLMDSHDEAVLNTINETYPTFASLPAAFALSIQAPRDDAMIPMILYDDDDDDDHQELDLSRNGDTPTDASSVASSTSWQSDTPLPRDFEDYYDFPYPNDMFDKAGMQALLEEEYLNHNLMSTHAQSPDDIDLSSHPGTM